MVTGFRLISPASIVAIAACPSGLGLAIAFTQAFATKRLHRVLAPLLIFPETSGRRLYTGEATCHDLHAVRWFDMQPISQSLGIHSIASRMPARLT
jgi:hypothetical protein